MFSGQMQRWLRTPASRLATRRETMIASLGGIITAAGLACDDEAGAKGKKKRCVKVNARCGGGKKCCSNQCCSGWCMEKGGTCCSKEENGSRGWCDAKYPVCCPPEILKDRCCPEDYPVCCKPEGSEGGCCGREHPVCCGPTSFEPDGYCCSKGYACVDTRERCELRSGEGVADGAPVWKASYHAKARQVPS